MLNEQLKKQIEQEAEIEASYHFRPIHSRDENTACKINYKIGANKYAEKWQEAEQKIERYEKALKDIMAKANTGIYRHLPVETLGAQMCIEIEKIATEALTPKPTTDDTVD